MPPTRTPAPTTDPSPAAPVRLLNLADVCQSIGGLTRQTIWKWQSTQGFPKPVVIGNRHFWVEAEVEAWIQNQIRARVTPGPRGRWAVRNDAHRPPVGA